MLLQAFSSKHISSQSLSLATDLRSSTDDPGEVPLTAGDIHSVGVGFSVGVEAVVGVGVEPGGVDVGADVGVVGDGVGVVGDGVGVVGDGVGAATVGVGVGDPVLQMTA